jgi:hypothetical protein
MREKAEASLISIEDGYARFSPKGFVTHVSLAALLEQVMAECHEAGHNRLLVDTRALEHAPLSGVDRYEFGAAVAEFWDRSILLAMLVRPDQQDPERFGQKVAQNRGLFVETFTDEAPAKAWMKRPPELKIP